MILEEMDVYKNGMKIIEEVYKLEFPYEEKFMLRDQLVRASHSIILNLSEGQAYVDKQRTHFYRIALGSCYECLSCVHIYNRNIKKLDNTLIDLIDKECALMQGMIKSSMRYHNTNSYSAHTHNPEHV